MANSEEKLQGRQVPLFTAQEKRASESEPESERPTKTIRLAVSGDVLLTPLEVNVIDSPEFQRLRKYRQLGTSYLVYPTALHTRFDHSLGVLSMAEKMMSNITSNLHSGEAERAIKPDERRLVRLTALLHDVANLPFGHTLEDETNVVTTYQEDRSRLESIVGTGTKLGRILAEELGVPDHLRLLDVLTAKKDPAPGEAREDGAAYVSDLGSDAFIFDLVKNTVCADLLDYLERDTYFCGLPLAVPDRFLKFLFLHSSGNGLRRVAIRLWKENDHQPRAALISELLQLLETRYFLAERVYFHHAKQISSTMIASAVQHALTSRELSMADLMRFGDDELVAHLAVSTKGPSQMLAQSLLERRLYKRYFAVDRDEVDSKRKTDDLNELNRKYHKDATNRARVELLLAERCGLEQGDVLIYCPHPSMNLKLAEMLVQWRGRLQRFQEIDDGLVRRKIESIQESHRKLWQLQVFVRDGALDSQAKRDLLDAWCRATFVEPDSLRNAVRITFEDVLRASDLEHRVEDIDAIVAESLAVQRVSGKATSDFTRETCTQMIKERLRRRKGGTKVKEATNQSGE